MKLFSLDSPFGKTVSMLADMCILNLLFLLTSLPVFTLGASCAALYDTAGALLRQEYYGLAKHYFRAFGRHFLRGTGLMLIAVAVGGFMVFDLMCALGWDSFMAMVCLGVIVASAYFYFAELALVPMILARDPKNSIPAILKDSFLAAIRGTWRTVIAVVLNVLPWGLLLFMPEMFLNTWMFWFLLGFAIVAYLNCSLLLPVVDPETAELLKTKQVE